MGQKRAFEIELLVVHGHEWGNIPSMLKKRATDGWRLVTVVVSQTGGRELYFERERPQGAGG